ncbi:response regulator [Pseudorhodoferax sp.]|uniref:response regulator n=1 Tax=Pseudorhodoferax sp. TaxID=1993553 RepID=UPI002DD65CAE|nr:response regulator [Pseudorhodoferax sp.]
MPHRVFLVEDNPLIRQTMTEMLEELSDSTVVAWADGEDEAVAGMQKVEWDVALIDLFLVQGSGLGVARAFAQRSTAQRVFIVSNYATTDIRERCSHLSIDGIFDKSTELDRLLDVLQATPRH